MGLGGRGCCQPQLPQTRICAHGYEAVALRRAIQANHGIPRVTNQAKPVFFELLQAVTACVAHLVASRSHSASFQLLPSEKGDKSLILAMFEPTDEIFWQAIQDSQVLAD